MRRFRLPQLAGLLLAALTALTALHAPLALAGTGLTELAATASGGPVTVFYPSNATPQSVERGAFTLQVAPQGAPVRGNGRLIVLSHGSGGSPWPLSDLARQLVEAGYIVALPEHAGDNWHDHSKVGPASWELRPTEVSHTIDTLAADPRFGPLFDPRRVGMWGMSAGGHTALTLAGGRWSRAQLLAHCEAHLADDFAACTGAATQLQNNWLDKLKLAIARQLIRWNLGGDTRWFSHTDARIQAIVAGVPLAADFDPMSLAQPVVPLGLVQAGQDQWLVPRFHSQAVLEHCKPCVLVADLPLGGHGALLSPLPQGSAPRIQRLLDDPPGFDRASLADLQARTRAFFDRHLLP